MTKDKADEPLAGEALKERASELEIQGRSSMKADELREAVAEEEGAPKTETPEKKDEESEGAPLDEEPKLETPENPVPIAARSAKPPKPAPAPATASPEIVELQKHVADNPVDSHAPVWASRPANSP